MKQFLKALWWFIDKAAWLYWVHPKQFSRFGGKWRRHKPTKLVLSNNFSISSLLLIRSKIEAEKAIKEVTDRKMYEHKMEMQKWGVFIDRWQVDCEVRSLPKTGDFDAYQITSIGILRKW